MSKRFFFGAEIKVNTFNVWIHSEMLLEIIDNEKHLIC